MSTEDLKQSSAAAEAETAMTDEGRREALLKIARYGAYVPPAMLALLAGSKAQAQSHTGS